MNDLRINNKRSATPEKKEETTKNNSHIQADHADYWRLQLSGLPEPLQFPSDKPRPENPPFSEAEANFDIPDTLFQKLDRFSLNESNALPVVLLATWQLLLHRYTEQNDIVICLPAALQDKDDASPFGRFVIRTDFSADMRFRELAGRVQNTVTNAISHGEPLYEPLLREINLDYSPDTTQLFQHWFIYKCTNPTLASVKPDSKPIGSRFDLSLEFRDSDRGLSGTLKYNRALYRRDDIERTTANYLQLLTSVVDNPDSAVKNLELVADVERQYLLEECNRTVASYPSQLGTHQLFEARVSENPTATAVIFDEGQINYNELNERANQLAHHLISIGVEPGKRVAVCLDRSIELVVTLLAVMKAGGAYVPLDPLFPVDRLSYMIADSEITAVVSQQAIWEKLFPSTETQVVLLEVDSPIFSEQYKRTNPAVPLRPDDLVYIIYTSGSTGKPKGVQIKHGSLTNFLCSMQKEPGLCEEDVLLSLTTICFDIAALEIFLPLITGARFIIKPRQESLTPEQLVGNIERHNVTIVQATPVTWRMLFNSGWKGKAGLKALCGGEAMGEDLAEKMLQARLDVWNLYGPTETTIWSSVCNVRKKNDAAIIGHPIANTQLYVCSAQHTLQPIGVPGELVIGGDGVAAGYYNRDEITQEKFVPHPFMQASIVYRTGDLVARRADGEIQFLGRIDNQVKIRGFRIELGDIESHLLDHPSIQEAAVVAREDGPGNKMLAAYFVPEDGVSVDDVGLINALREKLPEYMIPSSFTALSSLPLTPNNKIDRKKLPPPARHTPTEHGSLPPTGNAVSKDVTTEGIVEIFEQVLGRQVTSQKVSFFDLGGHSLSALTVVEKISRQFSINLPQSILFEFNTIEQLSKAVTELRKGASSLEHLKSVALNKKDKEKVDRFIDSLLTINGSPKKHYNCDSPKMVESWLGRNVLAPIYRLSGNSIRKIIIKSILKLEGGPTFTVTMRKIFKECHDIEVGDFSSVTFNPSQLRPTTRIGKYCSIFPTALIQNADHPRNTASTHALFYHAQYGFSEGYSLPRIRVEIGNDVWIGADAKILYPTQKIGDGAVIASGAVVVEDVPPYAIVGGYPARVIRYRFSQETIVRLLKSRWWEHDLDDLKLVREEFMKPLEGDSIR